MNEAQVAEAVADWLLDILSDTELGDGMGLRASYAYVNAEKGPLPDVMADVREKRIGLGADEPYFPLRQLQQTMLRTFECELSFLVETSDGAAAAASETALLRLYGATIESSAIADASLGSRLSDQAFCSPIMRINYDSPFIQYADGTRGRQMVATLAVGEMVTEDPQV